MKQKDTKLSNREIKYYSLGNNGEIILPILFFIICIVPFAYFFFTTKQEEKQKVEQCINLVANNMGYEKPIFLEYNKHDKKTWHYYVYHNKTYHRGIEIGDHEDKVTVEYDNGECRRITWKENGPRYFFDYNNALKVYHDKEEERRNREHINNMRNIDMLLELAGKKQEEPSQRYVNNVRNVDELLKEAQEKNKKK